MPKEKYSFAPEIFEHSQRIASTTTSTTTPASRPRVTELRWDEDAARWIVSTNRGDAIQARFVAMANGPLSRPKLPGIPGIDDFEGHTFHTSRWDYDYTGGDNSGGLTELADKRVGVIGTGATAIQCVPHLGAARQAALCLPAHALVSRRARNNATDPHGPHRWSPDGSGERRTTSTSWSSASPGRRGPGQRRLDRHLPQPRGSGRKDARAAGRRRSARAASSWSSPTSGR